MKPIVKIDEYISDGIYSKEISVFGIKIKSVVKTDKRSEKKESPIGFQMMNNILDHYPEV